MTAARWETRVTEIVRARLERENPVSTPTATAPAAATSQSVMQHGALALPSSTLAEFLQKLNLEKYVENFTAQDIVLAQLPLLTDEDFKELEVPMGPRRQIQAALAKQ